MITIQSIMLVALGFLVAALLSFLVAPLYRRRTARLATEELKRSIPLTEAEIRADKDRLRAEYAIAIHKLESKLDEASHSAAKQMVEINRRDAVISGLEGERAELKAMLEGHENARRVLEQTITDRLPRVEARLGEAKKLLFQRDREIATLTQTAERQSQALEEITQINAQQRDEIHRLNATLTTRAARNRETMSDSRFDSEVALRAEIEALRAKTRDQSALISRLQGVMSMTGARRETIAGMTPEQAGGGAAQGSDAEVARLRHDLSEAELALKAARGAAEANQMGQDAIEAELRSLRAAKVDQATEIANLKAALQAYESGTTDDKTMKESKIAMKARVSALQAQTDEQTATIQSLRAEIAAANEKLARQAQHFTEELRRLGAGTRPATGPARYEAPERAPRRTLTDRISDPRPERPAEAEVVLKDAAEAARARPVQDQARVTGFLRALDGPSAAPASEVSAANGNEGGPEPAAATDGAGSASSARRPGLLERITGLDKSAASGG